MGVDREMTQHPGLYAVPDPDQPAPALGGGNGRYDDHERRLRRLEEAITRIETRMEHFATREFIYKAILTGLISGLGLAAAITVAITRLLP